MIEWLGKIAIKHRIITNDVNITLIFFYFSALGHDIIGMLGRRYSLIRWLLTVMMMLLLCDCGSK